MNAVLISIDIIWFLTIGDVWANELIHNPDWSYLQGIHVASVIFSIINFILKIAIVFLIKKYQATLYENLKNTD